MAKKKETKEKVQKVEQVENVNETTEQVQEEQVQEIKLEDINVDMALRFIKSGLEVATKAGAFTMSDVAILNRSLEVLYSSIMVNNSAE